MIRPFLRKKNTRRWAKAAFSLGGSLAVLSVANAQDTTDSTPDRVIVTGSQIPTAAEVGASPVTVVDQAAVSRSGTDDPELVLQKSDPAFSGGGNLGSSNASINSGSTEGGSTVSIHGLTTLVLLDGRRIADSAATATPGFTGTFQDVNLFPAALIKRIEVLKDGASAIYGSDAVGGVVNVILNKDFQGFEIDGRYGFAEKGDIHDQRYSGVAGFGDDKTRIVVAAQYEEQDPVLQSQRPFATSRFNGGLYDGFTGYVTTNIGGKITIGGSGRYLATGAPAFFDVADGSTITNISPGQVLPVNSLTNSAPAGSITPEPVFNAAGVQISTGFSRSQLPAGSYTSAGVNYNEAVLGKLVGITLDQNRTNAYGSVERDIFDKYLTVFADFLYSHNYSQSLLAPQPVATNSSPNLTQDMVIPFGAPYNPFNAQIDASSAQIPGGVDATGAPAGPLVVTNRFLSAVRTFRQDTDFYRIVTGLRGEITKDYNWEVAFNHSSDAIDFKNFGLVRADLLEEALAGGYAADGTAVPATFTTNAAGQTVVATPAGPFSKVAGVLLPALDAFAVNNPISTERAILGTDIRFQQSSLTVIDAKITGFPITLPGGPLGFAIGGEYRREELKLNDSNENFVASVPVSDVQVGRDIGAGYAEVSIPVVSPTMKIPGVYSLDLDGAVRYEKYEGVNSAIVPKASFVYRPIVDVAVRGTFSGSFNAPTLIETSGPPTAGFTSAVALGAGFSEQANSISTSNPNLGPIRSQTWSGGIVLSPHQVPGLTMSADFFHVEEKGIITSPVNATVTLLDVNSMGAGASPAEVAAVHFGSPTGPTGVYTGTPGAYLAGNASNYFVVTSLANALNFRESTVDINVNYEHDFGKIGDFTVGLNGTYYLQAKGNEALGGVDFDQVGLYLDADSNYIPLYKLAPYFIYRWGGAQVTALGNYTPALRDTVFIDPATRAGDYTTNNGGPNLPKIRDYYTIDMTLSYEFGLHKPTPSAPAPAPKDGKDGGKSVVTSKDTAKKMMGINLLDGLKVTFGVNNITNAKPSYVLGSQDFDNTDAGIYDPYQRYYYFVVSKKF